jgi:hypothetical protein
MRQYVKVLIRGSLGLLAGMAMAGVAQVSAALLPLWQPSPGIQPVSKFKQDWHQSGPLEKAECIRRFILAQKKEPVPEKPKLPPAPAAEPEKMKQADAPARHMEKYDKSIGGEQLERAGTKKLGGEVIRHKDE